MRSILRRLLSSLVIATLSAAALTGPAVAETSTDGPPVLRSLQLPDGPYAPGSVGTINVDVISSTPIRQIYVLLAQPSISLTERVRLTVQPPSEDWRGGELTFTTPSGPGTAPRNGNHEVSLVTLGNATETSTYGKGGPAEFIGHLSVVGSLRDDTAPTLDTFSFPTRGVAGTPVFGSFSMSEAFPYKVGIYGLRSDSPLGEAIVAVRNRSLAGSLNMWMPAVGDIRVTRVTLEDTVGNKATYRPDGSSTIKSLLTGTTEGRHSLDIPSRVAFAPAAALNATAIPGVASATISWDQHYSAGYTVEVQPAARVIHGPPVDEGSNRRTLTLAALPNGVAQTVTITPTSPFGDGPGTSVSVTPRMGPSRVFGTGDRSKDGRADLWAAPTNPAGNATWRIYQGAGAGTFGRSLTSTIPASRAPIPGSATGKGPGAPLGALYLSGSDLIEPTATTTRVIGRGFNIFRTIDASSDLTGDGIADLIGITPAGEFYIYTASSTGALGRGVRLGTGWNAFQSVFTPGDFTGDGRSDVVGIDGTGKLWLYPGTGRAGFSSRIQIGTGWASMGSVFAMRDFSGDGKVDIGAITTDGKLRMYPGNGRGSFLSSSQIGTGWGAFL